jgi:hypothetical protein
MQPTFVERLGIGRAEPFYPRPGTLHKNRRETLLIITY